MPHGLASILQRVFEPAGPASPTPPRPTGLLTLGQLAATSIHSLHADSHIFS